MDSDVETAPAKVLKRPSPSGIKATKQDRSAERQQRIADAAVTVIASHGVAGVTHRLIARQAHVSLAATTYYYETKQDIVADASRQLLAGYSDAFRRFADRNRGQPSGSFRQFAMKLVTNAAGKHRLGTLAWCEIILDAAQHEETRNLARSWFGNLTAAWLDIATIYKVADPEMVVRSAIDVVVGLLFTVVPLGLSEAQAIAVLHEADDVSAWGHPEGGTVAPPQSPAARQGGRKAEETRGRILSAAVEVLIAGGPAAVTYRAVAERAGLTPAAPIYHYASIAALLNEAQVRLFEQSKDRYRAVMASANQGAPDLGMLTDLTTTIFLREATEFSAISLANYPVRLEAARDPSLRKIVWATIDDQNRAWRHLLMRFSPNCAPLDPLLLQSLFIGKLVRVLAAGATTVELANIRREFAYDLGSIIKGGHWSSIA